MLEKVNGYFFFIEDDDLLEKYNTIWDKVSADIKHNFIVNISIIKTIWKPKYNLMVMKLQIFMIKKKLDSNDTWLAAITFASALKKDDNYYPQVFLKECKCIEKKVGLK